jgi:WD40 repeat protein
LNTAQIILLLVSPDFMASDYCYSIEMQRAIERHEQGEAQVIPIILRPVYWQDVLGKLQALPTDGLPVTDPDWHNIDRALYNVTKGIRNVAVEVMSPLTPSSQLLPIEPSKPELTEAPANVLQQQTRKSEPLVTPEDFSWLCIRTLTGHESHFLSVAMSPDGQTLASDSDDNDNIIKLWHLRMPLADHIWLTPLSEELWNPKTGDLLRTLSPSERHVLSVAISPDGQTLASGSADQTIKLWKKK